MIFNSIVEDAGNLSLAFSRPGEKNPTWMNDKRNNNVTKGGNK